MDEKEEFFKFYQSKIKKISSEIDSGFVRNNKAIFGENNVDSVFIPPILYHRNCKLKNGKYLINYENKTTEYLNFDSFSKALFKIDTKKKNQKYIKGLHYMEELKKEFNIYLEKQKIRNIANKF